MTPFRGYLPLHVHVAFECVNTAESLGEVTLTTMYKGESGGNMLQFLRDCLLAIHRISNPVICIVSTSIPRDIVYIHPVSNQMSNTAFWSEYVCCESCDLSYCGFMLIASFSGPTPQNRKRAWSHLHHFPLVLSQQS